MIYECSPKSQVGYHAGKPIENLIYCFYKITLSKTESVSVFYEFTGTINHKFLTKQNARHYLSYLIKYINSPSSWGLG